MEENTGLEEEICILLKRISNLFNRSQQRNQALSGTMGSGYMLSLLSGRAEVNQRELVQLMRVRPASASEMLHKMELDGLIERRVDRKDRRNTLVSLTEKGRTREESDRNHRRIVSEQLLSALTPEERLQLKGLLQKLYLECVSGETGFRAGGAEGALRESREAHREEDAESE